VTASDDAKQEDRNQHKEAHHQEDEVQAMIMHQRPRHLIESRSCPSADQIYQIRHHPRDLPSQGPQSFQKVPGIGGIILSRLQNHQERDGENGAEINCHFE
jgi:hypothetical protein